MTDIDLLSPASTAPKRRMRVDVALTWTALTILVINRALARRGGNFRRE